MQVGTKAEASGIAKAGAKMVMAVACAQVSLSVSTSLNILGLGAYSNLQPG
jgi:acetyl-CoA carboxylase carboxyltransferase component